MKPHATRNCAVCLDNIRNYEGGEMGQAWGKNKSVATLSYLKRNPSQGMLVVWQTEGFWERLANSRLQQSP